MSGFPVPAKAIRRATTGDPPNRTCLAGSDEKWEGYLLGVEDAIAAIPALADDPAFLDCLERAIADAYNEPREEWHEERAVEIAAALFGVASPSTKETMPDA